MKVEQMEKSKIYELNLALSKITRMHSALEAVGRHVYPHPSATQMMENILDEIVKLYHEVDMFQRKYGTQETVQKIQDTFSQILKQSLESTKTIDDLGMYDQFTNEIQKYQENLDADRQIESSYFAYVLTLDDATNSYILPTTAATGEHVLVEVEGGVVEDFRNYGTHITWYENGQVSSLSIRDDTDEEAGRRRLGRFVEFTTDGRVRDIWDYPMERQETVEAAPENEDLLQDIGFGKIALGSMAVLALSNLVKKVLDKPAKKAPLEALLQKQEAVQVQHEEAK